MIGGVAVDAQLVISAAAATVLLVTVTAATVVRIARDGSPAPTTFEETRALHCPSDLRLLDRHGAVLHELRLDEARRRMRWVSLAGISPALQEAVLRSEDRRFFDHRGVDARAMIAAVWQRIRHGSLRGASTITMQLAAMLDRGLARGGSPRTPAAKWRQMRAAWALEARWTKRQILEAYLNLVTFRGELQGAAAAAAVLFDKAPHGLSHPEAAVLAALIRSPNAARDVVEARAKRLMAASSAAAGDPARAASLSSRADPLRAALDDAFASPSGTGPRVTDAAHAARRLFTADDVAGCRDRASTLDAELQRRAASSLHDHLRDMREQSVRDGAVLVVDNASGDVLAYVASSGRLSSSEHVDGIRALRQPGSALKPFLYALALDRRLVTAATLLEDAPTDIAIGSGVFRPRNYDHLFRGLVTVRTSLAASLNVPAVRTLQLVGADRFADSLRELGFDGIDGDGDFYGPSLALGSAEVSLWELVGAYRTLARGGLASPLRLTAADARDGDQESMTPPARRVLGEEAAFITADILADRGSRATTFELENALATRFWSAAKTGTSKDMRDNWCIGFSDRYTVGVWVGNFTGAPMHDVSGVSGAAPIWNDVLSQLHADRPSIAPPPPTAVIRMAAPGGAPPEWFVQGTEPLVPSQLARLPRIVSPADGSILTVDLDTPPQRQRVTFVADAAPEGAAWKLGDALLSAAEPALWSPVRGHHRLALLDGDRRELAAVTFEVRGGPRPPQD
ncbi:MAG TPA: penicillin-binding protein 1C [Candidatus Limnocylindrales bacterium]|nr:penicillin-binding protein 1C [Candidatus Limnocylindrales bacterium]